ncbi:MAG: TROVE domain-containing protein [Armatimonadetes bacterium]|nr:TROVE domain-containing protein [Armatimonadota bacterium]
MRLTKHFGTEENHEAASFPGQDRPRVPGETADTWKLLDRFLIFGTEGGTYYASEHRLTLAQAENALSLVKTEGVKVVSRIVSLSKSGRSPKNEPAIFALALASAYGDTAARQAAFAALPDVCRTGTHLFQFVAEVEPLRGWGRGMRRAIADWYARTDPDELTSQALRYQHRGGWTHRDLLRLSHPKPPTEAHRVLFKWIVDGQLDGPNAKIEAVQRLHTLCEKGDLTASSLEAASLIRSQKLTRECVPAELLTLPEVWDALLADMPVLAMVRNLANMTRCGLLTPGSHGTRTVLERLSNETLLRRARIHPLALLLAHATYTQGGGFRGSNEWIPVPAIVDALDNAFYLAFGAVEATGKRYVLGVDVSGSMSSSTVAGSPLTACEAATAMALVTLSTEAACSPMAFGTGFKPLPLSAKMRLGEALKHTKSVSFGGTDCALPMLWAAKHKVQADLFVIFTDNEACFGKVHPAQALEEYRQRTGIGAKLVVTGMSANRFAIADPHDLGMLDIIGFDATVPQVLREFAIA